MKENQSLVNKGKMDYYQPDCDLLSDLPLGIIHIILALIPIREAVRTCILSRHWRYIWTSLPQLVFDDRCASKKDESKTKYEDFITRVLFRHNGPIHKFKVHCPFGLPIPLDEWVYFLSRNDIRDLALAMGCYIPDWSQLMRSSIYSCKRLTNLELCNCELDPPPLTFKGFLFLKSLSLERVDMSCNGIESLVFVCPLLESLTLVGLWGPELNISAPNLKYLKLSCYCLKLYLYAPLLVEMLVEMRKDYSRVEHQQQKTSVCNYTNLLGGLTDLEKLTGSSGFSQSSKKEVRMYSDRLSNLPLGIIHDILARVPIQDAIRTSFLSKQWRYTWTSLPQLVFSKDCVSKSGDDGKDEKRLIHFVTRALLHHQGPIHRFQISVDMVEIQPKIDMWIDCLSRNDIRELYMAMVLVSGEESRLHLHRSLYACEKLTYLWLELCDLDPPPPTFKGFMFLKSLVLHYTFLSPELKRLVASCPLLERLELSTWEDRELRISALNLKYLDLEGGYSEMCVYAPLLAEMSVRLVNFDIFNIDEEEESMLHNYTNFFGGCSNLEKLIGCGYFTKFLRMGIEYCSHSILLCNLKIVDLQDVDSEDDKEIIAVARLIMGAPNLYQLKIRFIVVGDYPEDELEDGNVRIRDFLCAHNFSFEKLRFVSIGGLSFLFVENEFIKFLLESSPVLETMRLGHFIFDTDEIQSAVDDLLGCCRASPSARISFS